MSPRNDGGGSDRRKKKKFRSDGTPIWEKRIIDGPGVWATCVKGKEKQAIGELYDLFDSIAEELWPSESVKTQTADDSDESDGNLSLEAQIAKEVSAMKRPRKEQRFANCQTNTPCVIFISCKAPVDPVRLVLHHMQSVEKTSTVKTRHTLRLVPVSGTCNSNLPEIRSLCQRTVDKYFSEVAQQPYKYKIELRIRNFNAASRQEIIETVAACVPGEHKVDLENPEIFILVELFKSVCGISVVRDYYRFHKFNASEIAAKSKTQKSEETSRLEIDGAVV